MHVSQRLRAAGDVLLVCAAAAIDLLTWQGADELRWGQPLSLWVVPVLTVIVYPVLLLRRRFPRAVFALHWTYALAGVILPDYVPIVGLLVALHALARRTSNRWAGTGLCMCLAPIVVNAFNVADGVRDDERVLGFAATAALWTALTLQVWGSGRLAYAAERRAEQEKQEQSEAAVRAAVRAERLHVARELHDIVSHSVSAMILQAAGARTLVPRQDDRVLDALKAIETAGVDAMVELHRLLGLLRDAGPEEDRNRNSPLPSLQDIDSLVSSVRATGVDVEVVVEGHPARLDRSVGQTAYRIVQEALTNTIKYAGPGAAAKLHLRWENDGLTLTIEDQAVPGAKTTAELSSGHGLTGLAERAHLAGGTLKAGPVAEGFLVQAHLPSRTVAPPAAPEVTPPGEAL